MIAYGIFWPSIQAASQMLADRIWEAVLAQSGIEVRLAA